MKYGRYEYERSYLLARDCLIDKEIERVRHIRDKYIKGTTLRLREIRENDKVKFKLSKKSNLEPSKPGILRINTLYLAKEEFDKLAILEGFEIEKERHIVQIDRVPIGIDKILLNEQELFIAEVEFETEFEMNAFSMPLDSIMEITGILKYSGFEIAKRYSNCKSR